MRLKTMIAGLILASLVVVTGILGYMIIEDWSFLDSVYMTIISLTTVGYGETHPLSTGGRLFTLFLIIVGVGLILMLATRINEVLIEGNIRKVLGRRRMDTTISRLKNHFIICGYGRLGQKIDSILRSRGMETVIVERSPSATAAMEDKSMRYVLGQATDDEILKKAGIASARGLVAGVNSDADNVYIVLSAREMRPDIFILARTADPTARRKMLRAGADRVISPIEIGARRMAQSILQPNVTDFLDLAMADDRHVQVQMEELPVGPNSTLAGLLLRDSGIRADLNLIVVAIKSPRGQMRFNPGPDDAIEVGATLIAIGPTDKLTQLATLLDSTPNRDHLTHSWEGMIK